MKYVKLIFLGCASFLVSTGVASAHVVVKPTVAGLASVQMFSVSVPNERNVPTTALTLLIPEGLMSVTPTSKAGWTTSTKGSGSGDAATVTEIDWSGGSIPSNQRDDFTFSAQVPASPTTLLWKAYQTYSDGQVTSWDQKPDPKNPESEIVTPYSRTEVINDLITPQPQQAVKQQSFGSLYALSIIAFVLSIVSLARTAPKKSTD